MSDTIFLIWETFFLLVSTLKIFCQIENVGEILIIRWNSLQNKRFSEWWVNSKFTSNRKTY